MFQIKRFLAFLALTIVTLVLISIFLFLIYKVNTNIEDLSLYKQLKPDEFKNLSKYLGMKVCVEGEASLAEKEFIKIYKYRVIMAVEMKYDPVTAKNVVGESNARDMYIEADGEHVLIRGIPAIIDDSESRIFSIEKKTTFWLVIREKSVYSVFGKVIETPEGYAIEPYKIGCNPIAMEQKGYRSKKESLTTAGVAGIMFSIIVYVWVLAKTALKRREMHLLIEEEEDLDEEDQYIWESAGEVKEKKEDKGEGPDWEIE